MQIDASLGKNIKRYSLYFKCWNWFSWRFADKYKKFKLQNLEPKAKRIKGKRKLKKKLKRKDAVKNKMITIKALTKKEMKDCMCV